MRTWKRTFFNLHLCMVSRNPADSTDRHSSSASQGQYAFVGPE